MNEEIRIQIEGKNFLLEHEKDFISSNDINMI